MGSVGFDGEDEYRPSSSNVKKYTLPRTLLDGCDGINHVSVPRKLRSEYEAVKKTRCKSVTPPLPISRKKNRMLCCGKTLRKEGAKKSKLNMAQGHTTKDEEEVAETLNSMANMFSDANNANQTAELNNEPQEFLSSDSRIQAQREQSTIISSNSVAPATIHSSDLMNSTRQFDFLSRGGSELELPSSNLAGPPSASGDQSDSPNHRSRVSTTEIAPSVKQEIALEQVPRTQLGEGEHYCPMDYKKNGSSLLPSLSAGGAQGSETQGLCLRHPAWLENRNSSFQPRVNEESTASEKHHRSHQSWKRCSAHVYISHLIKVLQISESKKGSLETPTQLATCGGAEQHDVLRLQMAGITGGNGHVSYNKYSTEVQRSFLSQERPLQHSLALETPSLCTSTNQWRDYLSLGTGVSDKAGHCPKDPQQFHPPYKQSQNYTARPFSLPHNGYTYSSTFPCQNSALATQQAQLPTQYNTRVAASLNLPDWRNEANDSCSQQNYANTISTHFHSTLGSKRRQFSPSQQLFTSNMKIRPQHQLNLQYERNGATLYYGSLRHLPN